ncbi:MAG: hypothetical protein ACLQPD_10805 [Desulfomonilaceae bacterium]
MINNHYSLLDIRDSVEIDHILQLVDALVDRPNHFSLEWLQTRCWAAIPRPGVMSDMDAEWIGEAANNIGCQECFAITTELGRNPICYRIAMTQKGLVDFESQPLPFDFVIVPKDLRFAIMSQASSYFIVAGPKSFVRTAVGCSSRTARQMFLDYYSDEFWPDDTRQRFASLAKRYEPFEGENCQNESAALTAHLSHLQPDASECDSVVQVADRKAIDHLAALIRPLMDGPYDFAEDWTRRRQWAAVPIQHPLELNDAEWIAEAANDLGCFECFAISTDPGPESPECYRIAMTQQALLLFFSLTHFLNFVVIPEDLKFAIIKQATFYSIVGGPRSFVRKALGCSFRTARKIFVDYYASRDLLPDKIRTRLLAVARRYADNGK